MPGQDGRGLQRGGRTVLFVSHNMGIVTSLCPNVMWLDRGSVCQMGPAREVIDQYMSRGMADLDRLVPLKGLPRRLWLTMGRLRHPVAGMAFRNAPPSRRTSEGSNSLRDGVAGIGGHGRDRVFHWRRNALAEYRYGFPDGFRPDFSEPGIFSVDVTVGALPLGPDIYNVDVGSRSGDFHRLDYLPACQQVEVIAGPNTPGTIIRKGRVSAWRATGPGKLLSQCGRHRLFHKLV